MTHNKPKRKPSKKIGYVCEIEYDYHLEEDWTGVRIYPSLASLKHHTGCMEKDSGCGVVEVEITLKRVVKHGESDCGDCGASKV